MLINIADSHMFVLIVVNCKMLIGCIVVETDDQYIKKTSLRKQI